MSVVVRRSFVNISSRKIRQVVDLLRRKKASDALGILRFCEKREISIILTKLINEALSRATSSGKYDIENMLVDKVMVNEGPTYKRIQPRAQGRAFKIRMRTSHIFLELKEV